MRTQKEQETWELQCYGCPAKQITEDLKQWQADYEGKNPKLFAFSLLSDAQEMIEHNLKEEARQTINRVKFILNQHCN